MEPIIPMPEDILNKNSGIDNLNFLLHYPKVYVMDNHLAAGWCWLQELDPEFSYCFFHIDRHEDLRGGTRFERYAFLKGNPHVSIEVYTGLEYEENNYKGKVFVWDNYIKQIQRLFPNWFSKCYFACPNVVSDPPHYTLMPLNIVYNAGPLELYNNVNYWVKHEQNPFIVNLDIDYFFDDKGMLLYSDDYIKSFANNLHSAKDDIAVLTIALSPECCGGWESAFRVYGLIAKEIGISE